MHICSCLTVRLIADRFKQKKKLVVVQTLIAICIFLFRSTMFHHKYDVEIVIIKVDKPKSHIYMKLLTVVQNVSLQTVHITPTLTHSRDKRGASNHPKSFAAIISSLISAIIVIICVARATGSRSAPARCNSKMRPQRRSVEWIFSRTC